MGSWGSVLGLAGALVGGVQAREVSAVPPRGRCRPTALVTNRNSGTVSTIETRTKNPVGIPVGSVPGDVTETPPREPTRSSSVRSWT